MSFCPHLFGISFPLQSTLSSVFQSLPQSPQPVQQGLALMTPFSHAYPLPENLPPSSLPSSPPPLPLPERPSYPPLPQPYSCRPQPPPHRSEFRITYLTLLPSMAPRWLGIKTKLLIDPEAHESSPCPLFRIISHYFAIFFPVLQAAAPHLVSHVDCAISYSPSICSCCSLSLECLFPLSPVCLEAQPHLPRLSLFVTFSTKFPRPAPADFTSPSPALSLDFCPRNHNTVLRFRLRAS